MIWWFKEMIQPLLRGERSGSICADDFVISFQYK